MPIASRTSAVSLLILASLYGCDTVRTVTVPMQRLADRVVHPDRARHEAPTDAPVASVLAGPGAARAGAQTPAPYDTATPTLDAYKTEVAHHVLARNAPYTFSGRLPPLLLAVVVLNITVDRAGHVTRVAVQRSPNRNASAVALASMQRGGRLPAPVELVNADMPLLTFSETFLFNDDYRFQLRSLAGPQ